MNRGFQYRMATGRAILSVAVIISAGIWALQTGDYHRLAGMAVCILSTYLLYGLNSAFGIIKTRSYLAPSVYLLMYSSFSFLQDFNDLACIIPLLFIGSLFSIIRGYESENPQTDVFNAFFLAGMACLTERSILAAVPVLFVFMILLRTMTARGFLAAIAGFTVPYWIIAACFVLKDRTDRLILAAEEFLTTDVMDYNGTDYKLWIYVGTVLLIFILVMVPAGKISVKDKVKNRSIIKSLNCAGVYLTGVIIVIPAAGTALLPVMMLVTSVLFGYVMTQIFNRFTLVLMIVSFLLILGAAGYNLTAFYN